jgi:hypothetical protein
MKRLLVWVVALIALVQAGQAAAWSWPAPGPVLRPFSFGDDPYAGGQHRGLDVAGEVGADVLAPASGTVTFAGTVPGGGKTISIRTDDGRYSVTLLHLGSISVGRGAVVAEGGVVGTVDTSGDPAYDRPYVYLGVRIASDPQGYIDPISLLPSLAIAAPTPAEAPADAAPEATPSSVDAPPTGDDPPPAPTAEPVAAAEPVPAAAEAPQSEPPAVEEATEPVAASAPAPARAAPRQTTRATPAEVTAEPPVSPTSTPARAAVVRHPLRVPKPAGSAVPGAGRIVAAPRASHARVEVQAEVGPTVPSVARAVATALPLLPAIPAPPQPKPEARPVISATPAPVAIPPAASAPRTGVRFAHAGLVALLALVVGAAALALAFFLRRRPPGSQAAQSTPRMMGPDATDAPIEADPGRTGLAVCERATTHRTRRRLRRTCRRARPLSPSPRQPRPHGQRDGRARHAGDGRRGRRGGVAA